MANALVPDHQASHLDVTRIINGMPQSMRAQLGSPDFINVTDKYSMVQKRIAMVAVALESGWTHTNEDGTTENINQHWWMAQVLNAPNPPELLEGSAVGMDGTAIESWGRLHSGVETLDLDGNYDENNRAAVVHQENVKALEKTGRSARVLGIGPDGRKIYTKDTGARAGYRTATASQPSGPYNGREGHLLIALPVIASTDGYSYTTLGPPIPSVIVGAAIVPAGTNRGLTGLALIADAKENGYGSDVIVDPGYSTAEYFTLTNRIAFDTPTTFRPVGSQCAVKNGPGGTKIICGMPYSEHTPRKLQDIPQPGHNLDKEGRAKSSERFTERAKYYRYTTNGTTSSGNQRWRNPIGERLRSNDDPGSLRLPIHYPMITRDKQGCCARSITSRPKEFPFAQETHPFTVAWHGSYARRNQTETVNGLLKGGYVDISRGFIKQLSSRNINFYLAFTFAGVNAHIMQNWNDHPETVSVDLVDEPMKRLRIVDTVPIVPPDDPRKRRSIEAQIAQHRPQIGRDFNLLE